MEIDKKKKNSKKERHQKGKRNIRSLNKQSYKKFGRNLSSGLERNGSDNYLVVYSSKSSSNERSNPEDPL